MTKTELQLMRKTTIVVMTVVFLLLVIISSWYLRPLIFAVIAAYLLMLAMQRPIMWIHRWTRLPVPAAITVTYIIFFALMLTGLAAVLPPLIRELIKLSKQINIAQWAPNLADDIVNLNLTLTSLGDLFNRFSSSISAIFGMIGNTFSTLVSVVTLVVVSIHLSLEHANFYKKIYWFTCDERKVVRVQRFISALEKELGGWVIGQLSLMLIIGVATGIGLYLIGVPYALPLGILAGLLEIIPNIGPTLAAVPSVILAFLFGGPVSGVVTLLFYILLQQFEGIIITPQIMKNTAHVSPLVSILLITASLRILGAVGALLAIPVYIAVRTAYAFWIRDEVMGQIQPCQPTND